jgi:nucleotide-binding universal stress UspA family protein
MMAPVELRQGGVQIVLELNEILVPVDFSATSRAVFVRSLTMMTGEEPVVVLLHVLDPSLAEFAEMHELGERHDVMGGMRKRAEAQMEELRSLAEGDVEVQPVISEGIPFYEIIRKAEEFAVDAVVMGKRGMREHPESLFFGSTAERVIRGCSQPVIVLTAT